MHDAAFKEPLLRTPLLLVDAATVWRRTSALEGAANGDNSIQHITDFFFFFFHESSKPLRVEGMYVNRQIEGVLFVEGLT